MAGCCCRLPLSADVFAFYPSSRPCGRACFPAALAASQPNLSAPKTTPIFSPTRPFWIVVKNNFFTRRSQSRCRSSSRLRWRFGPIQNPARGFVRTAYFTPTVLPMIAAANLWLFFYTPGLGVLDQIGSPVRPAIRQLAGPAGNRALGDHHRDHLERGGVLHDLLPRRASDHPGGSERSRRYRGHQPLDLYAPDRVCRCLMPTTLFIAVNAMINSVKLIDHLFILTKGGPSDASKLILYYICEMAFAFFDAPSAAAMTMLVIAGAGDRRGRAVPLPRQKDALPMKSLTKFMDSFGAILSGDHLDFAAAVCLLGRNSFDVRCGQL